MFSDDSLWAKIFRGTAFGGLITLSACHLGQSSATGANPLGLPAPTAGQNASGISRDYKMPRSKEGLTDALLGIFFSGNSDLSPLLEVRYANLENMQLGYHTYNFYWSDLESSPLPSSTSPLNCPSETTQIPADPTVKDARGFHRYRCLSTAQLAVFDALFTHDASYGLQTGIVFYSPPAAYRYAGCTGTAIGGSQQYFACVPRDDAMDDYEDMLTFAADRYNGSHGLGKISHFVIWNENSSGVWFNYSPIVPNVGMLSVAQKASWIHKYADMMRRAHSALQRSTAGVMLYVSTEGVWDPQNVGASDPVAMGSRDFLKGLWDELGTSINWSVVVHPYGDFVPPAPGHYSFYNLEDTVLNLQKSQLQARGLAWDSLENPQAYILANEQGWPETLGAPAQALAICIAQEKSLRMPTLVAQAHNYFQSVEPPNTISSQGALFGLLPYVAPDANNFFDYVGLRDSYVNQSPTALAYRATNPQLWSQTNHHYCCEVAGVGCASPPVMQAIFRFNTGSHHFLTPVFAEGVTDGYRSEGLAWVNFRDATEGTTPLFACYVNATHDQFFTPDPGCENSGAVARSAGFVVATSQPGMQPIYRAYNSTAGDHLVTLNAAEANAGGYHLESILGYVPIIAALSPLYQIYDGHYYTLGADPSVAYASGHRMSVDALGLYALAAGTRSGLIALFACHAGADHFVSLDSVCEGQTSDGALGFLSETARAGTQPLYRLYNSGSGGHAIAYDPHELDGEGFYVENNGQSLGYAPFRSSL